MIAINVYIHSSVSMNKVLSCFGTQTKLELKTMTIFQFVVTPRYDPTVTLFYRTVRPLEGGQFQNPPSEPRLPGISSADVPQAPGDFEV